MKQLYRRIVTIGMISASALLAWVYCLANYSEQPVVIGGASFVLVMSVYILLINLMNLHSAKEESLKRYIRETATDMVDRTSHAMQAANDTDELERLSKAMYVQVRKVNTLLSQMSEDANANHEQNIMASKMQNDTTNMLLTDSFNKAVKLIIKYNEANTQKLLKSVDALSEQLTVLQTAASGVKDYSNLIMDINDSIVELKYAIENSSISLSEASKAIAANTASRSQEAANSASDNDIANSFLDAFDKGDNFSTQKASAKSLDTGSDIEVSTAADSDKSIDTSSIFTTEGLLAQDSINMLFAEDSDETKNDTSNENKVKTEAYTSNENDNKPDTEEFASSDSFFAAFGDKIDSSASDNTDKTDDPNRQLSPDEIAAMFEASKEEYRAKSDDDFKVAEHPASMSQDLIDALLNMSDNDDEELDLDQIHSFEDGNVATDDIALADVIPFPTKSVSAEPVDSDPNRQLSPDEIAALFAAAAPSSEPAPVAEPEPVVEPAPVATATPVNDDPNRQLSPDEIAALFASIGS